MSRSERGWSDLDVVIFGREPLLPSRLQEEVADRIPHLAARIESFEDYEDALDHCRNSLKSALIIVIEDELQPSMREICSNLQKPYSSTGWPAFGVVVRKGIESIGAYKWMASDKRIIDYVSVEEVSSNTVIHLFDKWWDSIVRATEEALCPSSLRETFHSISQHNFPPIQSLFYEQALSHLSPRLNLSWKDTLALRLAPLIDAVEKSQPLALEPHPALVKITAEIRRTYCESQDVQSFSENRDLPLAIRCGYLLNHLAIRHGEGQLLGTLQALTGSITPRTAGILKQLASSAPYLLSFNHMSRAA